MDIYSRNQKQLAVNPLLQNDKIKMLYLNR